MLLLMLHYTVPTDEGVVTCAKVWLKWTSLLGLPLLTPCQILADLPLAMLAPALPLKSAAALQQSESHWIGYFHQTCLS